MGGVCVCVCVCVCVSGAVNTSSRGGGFACLALP